MSIRQLKTMKVGGPWVLTTGPIPQPGPGEICVRPRAVSLNPVDYKNVAFNAAIYTWPHILGIEGAGIVESIGEGVTYVKPGDEVTCLVETKVSEGVFQDIFTAQEKAVLKKPKSLSFEEATTLPISFLTAGALITIALKVPLAGLTKTGPSCSSVNSVLILGGSSGVGSAAIQLLRTALPTATIAVTSSSIHHARLQSLGADACFERVTHQDPETLKAATADGAGFDAIIDAVGAGTDEPVVFQAIKSDGPKLHGVVINRLDEKLPEGLVSSVVGGAMFLDNEPTAMKYLGVLIERGDYKLPLKVEVVGEGLEAVERNVMKVPQVSGTKLVLRM